jgi:hypothetical protein
MCILGIKKWFPVISGTTEHIRRPHNISGNTTRTGRTDRTDKTDRTDRTSKNGFLSFLAPQNILGDHRTYLAIGQEELV